MPLQTETLKERVARMNRMIEEAVVELSDYYVVDGTETELVINRVMLGNAIIGWAVQLGGIEGLYQRTFGLDLSLQLEVSQKRIAANAHAQSLVDGTADMPQGATFIGGSTTKH